MFKGQMDDAVMGSSIYPFLANLFMRYYETTIVR